jgi:hypothetical protein
MRPAKDVGERLAGEPHEPFDEGDGGTVSTQPRPASTWVSGPAWNAFGLRRGRSTVVGGAPPSYPTFARSQAFVWDY